MSHIKQELTHKCKKIDKCLSASESDAEGHGKHIHDLDRKIGDHQPAISNILKEQKEQGARIRESVGMPPLLLLPLLLLLLLLWVLLQLLLPFLEIFPRAWWCIAFIRICCVQLGLVLSPAVQLTVSSSLRRQSRPSSSRARSCWQT